MNYNQSLNYIHSIPKFRRPLGNENLRNLLTLLGNPQGKLKFIHIAGTNGKGSTAAYVAEILHRSGYKTGLFTSPFLETFNDRIKVNDKYISDDDISVYTDRVKTIMEENNALVSEFAFVTAVSFLYFHEKQCDFVVLEVGMGGKLDATNVIDDSIVSVICKIGLDHTQYLGNNIEEIALEKCGIIRENGTVVSYPNEDVADIIKQSAEEKHARVIFADTPTILENGFSYKGNEYSLSLKGLYQPQNACVALEIVSAMREMGISIPENCVKDGLANTKWAARFEFISDNIIIDGGHNIDGIRALKKSLLSLNRKIVLVIAMMEDKDYDTCIRELAPIAESVIATQIDMPRCLDANKISNIIESINIPVSVNTNPVNALNDALKQCGDGIVCVCGSLFLAGEIRKKIKKQKKILANDIFI